MFTTRSLTNGLKYVSLAYLLFISRLALAASQQSCEVSVSGGVNFICGNFLPPYEPCSADFKLVQGKSTMTTTLWLLGEYHSDHNKTKSCLDTLTKNIKEHIVYVESTESGKEVACKDTNVNERIGRRCIGWDDTAEHAKIEKTAFTSQEWYPKIIENLENILKKDKPSDINMDAFLSRQQKELQITEKTYEKPSSMLRQIRAKIRVYDFLLKLRNKGHSYKNIFENELYDKLYNLPQTEYKIYKNAQKERNKKLIHTLSQAPNGIFSVVLAGKSHVVDEFPPEDFGAAEYVQEELRKGKTSKPLCCIGNEKC